MQKIGDRNGLGLLAAREGHDKIYFEDLNGYEKEKAKDEPDRLFHMRATVEQ